MTLPGRWLVLTTCFAGILAVELIPNMNYIQAAACLPLNRKGLERRDERWACLGCSVRLWRVRNLREGTASASASSAPSAHPPPGVLAAWTAGSWNDWALPGTVRAPLLLLDRLLLPRGTLRVCRFLGLAFPATLCTHRCELGQIAAQNFPCK